MKVLIAEDDPVSCRLLESVVRRLNYDVLSVRDGESALRAMQPLDAPSLAILDWMMPGLDGLEVCRRIRAELSSRPPYLILLTARSDKQDIVVGLQSGANDYITKPFDRAELEARLQVGRFTIELQRTLSVRVRELEDALSQIRQLQGLLPICAWCKRIRDDKNYWSRVEDYLGAHTDLRFTHGICPECIDQALTKTPAPVKR